MYAFESNGEKYKKIDEKYSALAQIEGNYDYMFVFLNLECIYIIEIYSIYL